MPSTPIYGLPYQSLSDPPDGAALGEDLALSVEAELDRIDTNLAKVLAQATNTTVRAHALDTPFVGDGDGVSFVAPSTGTVLIVFHDQFNFEKAGTASVITRAVFGNVQVRTGSIIGSGTPVNTPAIAESNEVGSKSAGEDGDSASATSFIIVEGLTPGNDYNVEHVYGVNTTSNVNVADSDSRRVLVLAVA